MATATAVCSLCGARLSRNDAACPKCGTEISWEGASGTTTGTPGVRCDVCGADNPRDAVFCQSCGARLRTPSAAKPKPRRSNAPAARGGQQPPRATPRRFEPWQGIAIAAIVILVAYLVYNEATRQETRIPSGTPAGFPAGPGKVQQDLGPLEAAVRARPNDPEALLHLANALHDQGAYPRAIETYARYLTIRPTDPDARVDMGSCFYQMALLDTANAAQYFARALAEMGRAHRDDPSHQPAVFNMGVVNLQMGNLDESNRWFREAVKINPNSDLGKRAQQMITQHSFSQ